MASNLCGRCGAPLDTGGQCLQCLPWSGIPYIATAVSSSVGWQCPRCGPHLSAQHDGMPALSTSRRPRGGGGGAVKFRYWLEDDVAAPRVVVIACLVILCGAGAIVGWLAHILRGCG